MEARHKVGHVLEIHSILIDCSFQCRVNSFIKLMETRAQVFDMMGGLISAFPWIRYIAPEFSGYNLLCTLNKELKDFLMVCPRCKSIMILHLLNTLFNNQPVIRECLFCTGNYH